MMIALGRYSGLLAVAASLAACTTTPAIAGPPVSPRPGSYPLPDEFRQVCQASPVFEDTFFHNDVGAWTVITRAIGPNPNKELQGYRPQNVRVGEGSVRLWATREPDGTINSGRLVSRQLFHYGCFEVVARMPAGKGMWPAIWLRTDFSKPINGEIDMMEGFGSHPGVIQSTIHHWQDGKHLGSTCTRLGGVLDTPFGVTRSCSWSPKMWNPDFTTYHRYALVWSPTGVSWYLDGTLYMQTTDFIPDRDMAIHLNLAVGGVFDGSPDDSTHYPAAMEVKSVRAWPLQR